MSLLIAVGHRLTTDSGYLWFLDEYCQFVVDQGHLSHHPHGLFCRPGCSGFDARRVALQGCYHHVSLSSVLLSFSRPDQGVSGRASSIAIILGGSIYYTWVKHQENQLPQASATTKNGQQYDRLQMEDVESGKLSRSSSHSGKPE